MNADDYTKCVEKAGEVDPHSAIEQFFQQLLSQIGADHVETVTLTYDWKLNRTSITVVRHVTAEDGKVILTQGKEILKEFIVGKLKYGEWVRAEIGSE